jgi:hypothetical protein
MYFAFTPTSYIILYGGPWKSYFHENKLNPKYPGSKVIWRELSN